MAMLFVVVGRVAVAFHDQENPSDAEWNDWVALCTGIQLAHRKETRAVIRTLGGAPNPAQRALLGKAIGGKGLPGAVLTSSALIRGAVTAISWLGIPVRAFKPDSWAEIRAYLELNASETNDVQAALARISHSSPPPSSATR